MPGRGAPAAQATLPPSWDLSMKRAYLLRLLAALAVAAAAVVAYWWIQSPAATKVSVGERVPELQLPTLGGTTLTRLSQFRGHPVLLWMFMTRCPVCEKELPRVERLHREFLQRGLIVLGVAADADPAELVRLGQLHAITFYVLHDPNGVTMREAFGTSRVPEAYLIDREGIVRAVYLGQVAEKGVELRERIERLLGPARSASE
jgi:peroxiredoxin